MKYRVILLMFWGIEARRKVLHPIQRNITVLLDTSSKDPLYWHCDVFQKWIIFVTERRCILLLLKTNNHLLLLTNWNFINKRRCVLQAHTEMQYPLLFEILFIKGDYGHGKYMDIFYYWKIIYLITMIQYSGSFDEISGWRKLFSFSFILKNSE